MAVVARHSERIMNCQPGTPVTPFTEWLSWYFGDCRLELPWMRCDAEAGCSPAAEDLTYLTSVFENCEDLVVCYSADKAGAGLACLTNAGKSDAKHSLHDPELPFTRRSRCIMLQERVFRRVFSDLECSLHAGSAHSPLVTACLEWWANILPFGLVADVDANWDAHFSVMRRLCDLDSELVAASVSIGLRDVFPERRAEVRGIIEAFRQKHQDPSAALDELLRSALAWT